MKKLAGLVLGVMTAILAAGTAFIWLLWETEPSSRDFICCREQISLRRTAGGFLYRSICLSIQHIYGFICYNETTLRRDRHVYSI
jgi:hypothetical protein